MQHTLIIDWSMLNLKIGMGKIGLILGNSTKCHEKSMFGKPFCVAPNTWTSYCSPGFSPKNQKPKTKLHICVI